MIENQPQDAITYSQPLIKEITDESTNKLFEDKNLLLVLKFLRTKDGPMTVKELENEFKNIREKKSNKTIYRYLKRLESAGLIVHAGKRVFPKSKNKLTTQTLYMRSAKIFFPLIPREKVSQSDGLENDKLIQAVGLLLENNIKAKLISIECLRDYITQIIIQKNEISRKLIHSANNKTSDLLSDLDWKNIESMLSIVSFLVIINDERDWKGLLRSCFH